MLIRSFPDNKKLNGLIDNYTVIPNYRVILNDTETPVSILGKIYPQNGVFLFESVEGGERWGRYSFLGLNPFMYVYVFKDHIKIQYEHGKTRTIPHNGSPLNILRDIMSGFKAPEIPDLPRFWGGFVGYFCYEFVSFFEPVPNHLPKNEPLCSLIVPRNIIIFDHKNHEAILTTMLFKNSDGEPNISKIENNLNNLERLVSSPGKELTVNNLKTKESVNLEPQIEPEEFRQKVRKAKQYITDGEIIQVVISQKFQTDKNINPWLLYRLQRYINPSPYMFYFNLDGKVLVGSSPETMVRLEFGSVSLRPIAGTRPRGKTEQEDRKLANELLNDEKERAEHIMLVDLGRNDLGRVAEAGSVQVTEYMTIERYSHVMHLVSSIQANLKSGLDAWDVLKATFPAGTLTGAPKVRAMQIIAELEQGPRGPYGGAIGYISFQGNMDLAITIRTAEVEKDHLTVQAGAGIVFDSDPERERLETIQKAKAIEHAINLISKMEG